MRKNGPPASAKSQMISGLRLAASTLIFIVVAIAFFLGALGINSPAGRRSVLAWVLFGLSSLVILLTQDRWAKALPGILRYSVLLGIIKVVGGNSIRGPHSRIDTLIITIYIALCAAASRSLETRRLTRLDRVCLMIFVFGLDWAIGRDAAMLDSIGAKSATLNFGMSVGLAVGGGALALSWAHDRFQHRRRHRSSAASDHVGANQS